MLEVCVDSIESALIALEAGASRIELCSALSEGGLTPTPGTLKTLKTIENFNIPIFCMLRPRRGNDFNYTSAEIQALLYDIELLRQCGSDGFVFGALDDVGKIDIENCKRIIRAVGDLPITFHRAFDMTDPKSMHETVQTIKELGFKRILSSGFENTAEKGRKNLKDMIEAANNDNEVLIMPGSGINPRNLEHILSETGCKEFHASGKVKLDCSKEKVKNVSMGSGTSDAEVFQTTNFEIVQELVQISKRCQK